MSAERIILTSNSFPPEGMRLRQEFLMVVGKPVAQIRVMFIPTASAIEPDRSFMHESRQTYLDMGILPAHIVDVELSPALTVNELAKFDVIHVDGGNTFYLMQKIKETGFENAIKEYLRRGLGVYVGMSAGTIVAGPDIEIATPFDDSSRAQLKSTVGMRLVPTAYSPHFQRKDISQIKPYIDKRAYPIRTLKDGEGVVSDGVTERVIVV
ncbi:MAG: hypothetical protein RLZZ283_51 [Candidatus Parcubacteria bacterium]